MECKACGVASENTVFSSLLERLARISGEEPRPFKQLEVVLLAPSYTPGTRGAEIRLVRQIPINVAADGKGEKAVSTWTVRHEGMPMLGKGANELAATVRAVTESTCRSADALGFWIALGLQRQYSMLKEGSCLPCYIAGQPINVTVFKVFKEGQNGSNGEQIAPGFWMVEATAHVAEGKHAAGAMAIGSFAGLLQPLVALEKP